MKRYTAIRVFSKAMEDGDIALFIGNSICKEACLYEREGNFYVDAYDNMLSIALGMAMCTDRRVFVFCEDSYFLRNISEILHVAVSKCVNLNLIVFLSGIYGDIGKHPTIYSNIRSLSGIMFNMGFIVHDYKRHFKNMKNPIKEIKSIWAKIKGPFSVLLEVDPVIKEVEKDLNLYSSIEKIQNFIKCDIPAYNYISPVSIDSSFIEEE